jgi:hypothetical protein
MNEFAVVKALRTVFLTGNVNFFDVFQEEHAKKEITVLSSAQSTSKDGLYAVSFGSTQATKYTQKS